MNTSTACSNMNTEDGSLRLSQLSADLDLFEFFDMEGGDDLFESANDGSFDLDNFMDVQMEEFHDPMNDDTKDQGPSSQSHTRISLDDDSFRSAFNEEPTPDDSFNSSASSPDHCNSSSSSNQYHSEAQYNSALQNLAESMKRTEESRRYVMQMQREMLTESQKKALSLAKEQLRQQNQMQQQPTTTSPVQHQASRRRNSSAMSSIISAGSQTVGRYMYRQVTM